MSEHDVAIPYEWPFVAKPSGALVLRFEHDLFDHFVAQPHGIGEPRSKVLLDAFEPVPIGLKGTEGDAIRPCLCQRRHLLASTFHARIHQLPNLSKY